MSLEKKIVAACIASRKSFDIIEDIADDVALPTAQFVLARAKEYYERDTTAYKVDIDWLKESMDMAFDNQKKANEYKGFVDELIGYNVSADNIAALVVQKKKKDVANRLAVALVNDAQEAAALIDEYNSIEAKQNTTDEEEVFCGVSIEDSIASVLNRDNLIKLPTKALNDALDGGLVPENHVVIAARPETGKTALLISIMRAMGYQKLHGIYFGNEDPIRQIILRSQCSFAGFTKEELRDNPAEANARLAASGWEYVRFIPLVPGTPAQIRKYCKMYRPKWIMVDQLRNLRVKADTRVNQLETAATELRNIAKEFKCVVFSVTQAGDSAANKLVLDMGDIDGSNTGIPAQADLMIMIGVNQQFDQQNLRTISLPKNKISGKHVNFPLRINPFLSRYEDV